VGALAKKSKTARRVRSAVLGVTAERLSHGAVEQLERPIADEHGAIARPSRAIDILAAMERRGAITPEMRQAGEDFRNSFRRAGFDPLRAANWLRGGAGFDSMSVGLIPARNRVWRALTAVGGLKSADGACLWHVIGGEQSLKEWAQGQGWAGRQVSQEVASGILVAALGVLAQHFELIPGAPSRY
jgi:Domain of unknown function (DUF6456)